MKKTLLNSIFIILNLMVIDKALATTIYNELEFELPISHEKAMKIFSLDPESPLRKGDVDNRETLVHKGENSDVVGITFYTKFGSYKELEEAVKFHHAQLEKNIEVILRHLSLASLHLLMENTTLCLWRGVLQLF